MKKHAAVIILLAVLMLFSAAFTEEEEVQKDPPLPAGGPLELTAAVPFEGAGRDIFKGAVKEWEDATGNKVVVGYYVDGDDGYAEISDAFAGDAAPDVMYFPTDGPADELVRSGAVASISEIREAYPSYASNMKDGYMPKSTLDQQLYAVPVSGSFVSLFYNPIILEEAGVATPGKDYSWDQFLSDCQMIKDSGYLPIAASLEYLPHYWFEYTVMNHGTVQDQTDIPSMALVFDKTYKKWLAGLNDIKDLYSLGFFPEGGDVSQSYADSLFYGGQAAFMLGNNQKIDYFREMAPEMVNDLAAGYVPAQGGRLATDILSGITDGYYISKKTFDSEEKRDAAVSLVDYLTRDGIVKAMGGTNLTALKNNTAEPIVDVDNLADTAAATARNASGASESVMDFVSVEAKGELLSNVYGIAMGDINPKDVLSSVIDINKKYPR